jgi:hypothetical protein
LHKLKIKSKDSEELFQKRYLKKYLFLDLNPTLSILLKQPHFQDLSSNILDMRRLNLKFRKQKKLFLLLFLLKIKNVTKYNSKQVRHSRNMNLKRKLCKRNKKNSSLSSNLLNRYPKGIELSTLLLKAYNLSFLLSLLNKTLINLLELLLRLSLKITLTTLLIYRVNEGN